MYKNSKNINGSLRLYYNDIDQDDVEFFEANIVQSANHIQETWGLKAPKSCCIYIMDSWVRFLFHAAPWLNKILCFLFFPLIYFRMKRMWNFCGGWTMLYWRRPAIGIKPTRLLKVTKNKRIGEMINIKEDNEKIKLQNMICHELTHAYSRHLKLPMWLNEGLAMITTEKYIGKQTVKYESLKMLKYPPKEHKHGAYKNMPRMKDDTIAYHYAKGYWLTRFLHEKYPSVLKLLLQKRHSNRKAEKMIASALEIPRRKLWTEINNLAISHFSTENC